jgi:hypothetical protein
LVTGISRTPEAGNRCHGKGSAFNEWSSPLDYLLKISDLHIHIRVASHHTLLLFHQDLDFALRFQSQLELRYYRHLNHTPLHTLRLQLLLLNELEKNPEYIAAPPETVKTLHDLI